MSMRFCADLTDSSLVIEDLKVAKEISIINECDGFKSRDWISNDSTIISTRNAEKPSRTKEKFSKTDENDVQRFLAYSGI